jgi:hypothetical protein
MDVKAVIKNFSESQISVEETIVRLKNLFLKEDELWKSLANVSPLILTNERVMNFFADNLQMINNQERIEQFDLQDIKSIYQILIQYNPDNLQYQIDLIEFVYAVLNDEHETMKLIENVMNLMDEKRVRLQNILNEITIK